MSGGKATSRHGQNRGRSRTERDGVGVELSVATRISVGPEPRLAVKRLSATACCGAAAYPPRATKRAHAARAHESRSSMRIFTARHRLLYGALISVRWSTISRPW